jgi:hypothetical protein
MKFKSVGIFANDTDQDITIYLELLCEEIIVSPAQNFELLIEDLPNALPVTIYYCAKGLHIYPHQTIAEWLIIFNGKKIKPGHPTVLKQYEFDDSK